MLCNYRGGLVHIFLVDESGNLGTKDTFFVMAAFNTPKRNEFKNILKRFYTKNLHSDLAYTHPEIKGSALTFPQKQILFTSFCNNGNFNYSYIVANKTKMSLCQLKDKNITYNYLLGLLIQEIIKSNFHLPQISLHLDNHDVKVSSKNSFEDYIKIKAKFELGYQGEITVDYFDSHVNRLIQAADVIANTIWQKYEKNYNGAYNIIKPFLLHQIQFPK